MGERVTLLRLFAKAVLHLATEAVQLFPEGGEKPVETLPVLLLDPAIALLEDAVSEVFKLLAQALLAVDHLADFIFCMQLGGLQSGGDLTQIGLQRGVDLAQAAQFIIQQFALVAPVLVLYQPLSRRAQFDIQLAPLFGKIGPQTIGMGFCRQPAYQQADYRRRRAE